MLQTSATPTFNARAERARRAAASMASRVPTPRPQPTDAATLQAVRVDKIRAHRDLQMLRDAGSDLTLATFERPDASSQRYVVYAWRGASTKVMCTGCFDTPQARAAWIERQISHAASRVARPAQSVPLEPALPWMPGEVLACRSADDAAALEFYGVLGPADAPGHVRLQRVAGVDHAAQDASAIGEVIERRVFPSKENGPYVRIGCRRVARAWDPKSPRFPAKP